MSAVRERLDRRLHGAGQVHLSTMPATFDAAMRRVQRRLRLKPGDIYESCSYHPVLCLGIDYKDDSIWGVSLIDGSFPGSCSLLHCGIRKLTPKQAWSIKRNGPEDAAAAACIAEQARWWKPHPDDDGLRVGLIGPRSLRKTKGGGA